MTDSVADMVKTNKTKIWPLKSSKYKENATKFKLAASSISSIAISVTKMFFRVTVNPDKPIKKTKRLVIIIKRMLKINIFFFVNYKSFSIKNTGFYCKKQSNKFMLIIFVLVPKAYFFIYILLCIQQKVG